MHRDKRERIKRGRGTFGKAAVMGLLNRHGEDGTSTMRFEILSGLKRGHVQGKVRQHVESGSNIYTDAFFSYRGLENGYVHKVIDHAECYVKGQVHTNGCENFWSLLKRALKGTYVSVEPFHLFRYLDEQCFRFNSWKVTDFSRFSTTLRAVTGKRLTYRQVTGVGLDESLATA